MGLVHARPNYTRAAHMPHCCDYVMVAVHCMPLYWLGNNQPLYLSACQTQSSKCYRRVLMVSVLVPSLKVWNVIRIFKHSSKYMDGI